MDVGQANQQRLSRCSIFPQKVALNETVPRDRTWEKGGFRIPQELRNYADLLETDSQTEAAAFISGPPRVDMSVALTHSTAVSWFLSLAHLPSPITSQGTLVSLLDIFPLLCCPHIPGCFAGAPGGSSRLLVPSAPSTEARTRGDPVLHQGW